MWKSFYTILRSVQVNIFTLILLDNEVYTCMYYILNDLGNPVAVDENQWSEWVMTEFQSKGLVGRTVIDGVMVETRFLAAAFDDRPHWPLLWQTTVSGGALSGKSFQCSGSREQAEAMHDQTIKAVFPAQV